MKFFPNRETIVAFSIGGFNFDIRWYAALILFGALIAYYVSKKEYKRAKYTDLDFFDSFFIYALWFGIIGARLWFCIFFDFKYYMQNPIAIIRIWDGGLAIQGGVVAGTIFAYIYCKVNKYPFMKMLDIVLPNALIGQCTGRWGNFVNRECHGAEVGAEYFDGILSFLKDGMLINGHYYEPLFFYESMLCLLGWLIIHFGLRKTQNKRGDLTYGYLMWYGIVRFFIEGKRTDSLMLGNIRMAQLTSILFIVIGLLGYFGLLNRIFKKKKPTIIFDFDGTLIDTSSSIIEAYRECFKVYSSVDKFTAEVQEEVLGPALKTLFPKYFPGYDYDTVYKTYRDKQIEVTPKLVKPLPNTVEVVRMLHEQGYKLGILSTRTTSGIKELLEMFGLTECFDDICGLNEVKNLKPDPEGIINLVNSNKWNRDVVLVGDSMMDIGCGNNYGAYTVAYLNNPNRSKELAEVANETITDMSQLLDILNKSISFTYDKI